MVTTRKPTPSGSPEAKTVPEQLTALASDARLARLNACRQHPELLYRESVGLLEENRSLFQDVAEVRSEQEKFRKEMESLLQPEHYLAVLTAVEQNGRNRATVHIAGMSPIRVEVHPDVPPEMLRIGAEGYVSRARNCLLEIRSDPPDWPDIGSFEESLSDGRILVKNERGTIALLVADQLRPETLHHGDRVGYREDARVAYVRIPATTSTHLFSDTPEDDFAELGGLESQIRLIRRALEFHFRYPELAERFQLPRKQGILLVGPPGNGKTRLARCSAHYLHKLTGLPCRFQSVIGSEDYSMWLGASEAQLKARFLAARDAAKSGPCVIFFDELDALGRDRGSDYGSAAPGRILSTLLGLMDDVQQTLSNVILIGATNRADALDAGLTRPGRLDLKVTVPRPNRRAAESVLTRYLARRPHAGEQVQELIAPLLSRIYSPRGHYADFVRVRLNDGRLLTFPASELVSGAMLEHVVRQAAQEAAVRQAESGNHETLTLEDLTLSLDRELHGTGTLLSPANVKAYVQKIPQDAHPVEVTVKSGLSLLH